MAMKAEGDVALTTTEMLKKAITDLVDFSKLPEGLEVEIDSIERVGTFNVQGNGGGGTSYEMLLLVEGSTVGAIDIEVDVYDDGHVEAQASDIKLDCVFG